MKILHVLQSLTQRSGGPVRTVVQISYSVVAYGIECEVVGIGKIDIPDNPLSESVIHSCRSSWPESYCYSRELRAWLRKNLSRFDGVVLHGMWLYPGLVGAQECLRAGIPYACFPHGMLEPWAVGGQGWWKNFKKRFYWYVLEKYIFSRAQWIVYTTKREFELSKSVFVVPQLSTILAPFGVYSGLTLAHEPVNDLVLQAAESAYVLFLGRIHAKKNVGFLLHAWAQARIKGGYRLVIVGPGEREYLKELKRTAARLGLNDNVVFVDFVSGNEKLYLLQNARWLVLPSQQENFGITILEALDNGCPVVISDQVFLADELKDEAVILPLVLQDWVDFFRNGMKNEMSRRICIDKGRMFCMKNYEMTKIAKLWSVFFNSGFSYRRMA